MEFWRENFFRAFLVLQTFQTFFLPQHVDIPLSENGAQPGGKFAAAMKMIEERDPTNAGFPAIKRRIQRVGEFASIGIACRAPGNSSSGGVKILAIGGEKIFPGRLAPRSACASQSKV